MNTPSPQSGRRPSEAPSFNSLPSLFVVLALLALLVAPLAFDWRVRALRGEMDTLSDPAQALAGEIQYLLARQNSVAKGYLLTGDAEYLEAYQRYALREQEAYGELQELAVHLPPAVAAQIAELTTLSRQWHEAAALPDPQQSPPLQFGVDVLEEQDLYFRTLEAAGRVDLALRAATVQRREQIRGVESFALGIHSLLLVLASGAVVAILRINGRMRVLATEAQKRHVDLERAMEDAARSEEARNYLMRGFTHDVKNPLGAADGFAELLEHGLRGELSHAQVETVARIRRSIRGAIDIIDELLELSQIETGGLRISRAPVHVDLLVGDVVRHYSGAAAAAKLELTVGTYRSVEEGVVAYTDPGRVRRILENLISNALKYTPAPGRIVLSVHDEISEKPPHPGEWLTITVADDGPGIPPEEQDRIFDEFHRVPGTSAPGHGLGLAISRRIARLLGGDVTVRSEPGRGATFALWLPLREERGTAGGGVSRMARSAGPVDLRGG